MPVVICKRCGKQSNSAISEYWTRKPFIEGEADGCYAAFVNTAWEPGCLYGTDELQTQLADHLIAREAQ